MKFTQRDLVKLKWPLVGALLLLVIAGLLAWWSQQDAQKAEQQRNSAENSKNQIEQRLRQVRTEEQELKQRAQIFQQMQKSGIAGEEKRLDWTEMLRAIQSDIRLPAMTYEFGAQIPLENMTGQDYAYFASPMRLQLRLLHEEDLLNFLARLQKEAKALVLIRSCKLSPLPSSGEVREVLPQLSAECELQWITVRRSTGTK